MNLTQYPPKSNRRPIVSTVKSIAAPIGGWNARDGLAAMPELDAVKMDNMFPNTTDVMVRKGFTTHVTGITGTVETLAHYASPTANSLFASTSTAIYDATSAGAVGAAVVTGITNGRWQHVNFNVPGGAAWLCMVNGVDKPEYFNGTTWIAIDGVSVPAITGVTTTNLVHIEVFKRRIWFVERNTTKAWYLPVDSIGGAAASFDVGPLFTDGGYLVALGTWTLDAGQGMDDHLVFMSSKGQYAIYKGTDPSSSTTFALVGVYDIGSPVGRRCFIKFGGDLYVITRNGVYPLSKALMSQTVSTKIAITDKIQSAMAQSVLDYGSNFGWQLQQYPNVNMLLLNVPASTTEMQQYVMNTISGAWCRFTGWNASCWELFNEEIYFGTSGGVNKAWSGQSDNMANVVGDVIPAFSYFGNQAQLKRWVMARPILSTTGDIGVMMAINTDFDTAAPLGTPTLSSSPAGIWDIGLWDVAIWGGNLQIIKNWQTVYGLGYSASLHLLIASKYYDVRWQSTDFVFERGAVI